MTHAITAQLLRSAEDVDVRNAQEQTVSNLSLRQDVLRVLVFVATVAIVFGLLYMIYVIIAPVAYDAIDRHRARRRADDDDDDELYWP